MIQDEYARILVPLEDTYCLGGRYVFEELQRKKPGKNLIVITSDMCQRIKKSKFSTGGKDAVEFLESLEKTIISNDNGIMIHKVNEGMDVAYIHDNPDFKELGLKQAIEKNFSYKKGIKIISKNSEEKLKYRSQKIDTEDPSFLIAEASIVNRGIINGNDELLAKLYENKNCLSVEESKKIINETELFHNQFIKFMTSNGQEYARVTGNIVRNKDKSRIARIDEPIVKLFSPSIHNKKYKIGKTIRKDFFGIYPRDMEQFFAIQFGILNPDVELSFICGLQGSGKTLLSYTAAVDLILRYDKKTTLERETPKGRSSFFKNIVLLKPNNIIGDSSRYNGFLPGDQWEKEKIHLEPYIDAHKMSELDQIYFLDMILHPKRKNDYGEKRNPSIGKINGSAYLPPSREAIEIGSSGYLRGRSFERSLILVDEAQNFTPYEMKTIISRGGYGTKIVIMGDPDQFDNPSCSRDINGLTAAIKEFLPKPQTSLVRLATNYRFQSSEDALNWKVFSNS